LPQKETNCQDRIYKPDVDTFSNVTEDHVGPVSKIFDKLLLYRIQVCPKMLHTYTTHTRVVYDTNIFGESCFVQCERAVNENVSENVEVFPNFRKFCYSFWTDISCYVHWMFNIFGLVFNQWWLAHFCKHVVSFAYNSRTWWDTHLTQSNLIRPNFLHLERLLLLILV